MINHKRRMICFTKDQVDHCVLYLVRLADEASLGDFFLGIDTKVLIAKESEAGQAEGERPVTAAVRYVNCRGIDNKTLAKTGGRFYATPGCRIVSAMTFPFGAKVMEVAKITTGTCPSCGLDKQTLHAGICSNCREASGCGS